MKDNVIIAEFMELPLVPCNIGTEYGAVTEGYMHPKGDTPFTADGLQYKYSWDWLMPVISKCLEVGSNMSVERIYHSLHTQDLSFAYKEVVEFIKEHNSKDFDWCNDSGFSDVFDNNLCECTAPQVNDGMCICGRPIIDNMTRVDILNQWNKLSDKEKSDKIVQLHRIKNRG